MPREQGLHLVVVDRYAESCFSQSYCLVAMMAAGR